MKTSFLILLLLAAIPAVYSQSINKPANSDSTNHLRSSSDYIIMKDGIIMLVRNGTAFSFNGPMTLKNGTSVNENGSYGLNGHFVPLKDGDSLYLTGRIVVNARNQPASTFERIY